MRKIYLLIILFMMCFCFSQDKLFAIEEHKQTQPEQENTQIQSNQLTIDDCIKLSLENSPEVKRYQNLLRVAKSKVGQARSDYFPGIKLGGAYNFNHQGVSSNYWTYGASLKQMLFNFGKTGALIKMQKFNEVSANCDLDYVILSTIFNVRLKYYSLLASKANFEVEKFNVEVNKRRYQLAKGFFDEGLKSKIDLVNAEANLSNSQLGLISAESTYDQAVISLNNAMYIVDYPDYQIKNTETFNLPSFYTNVSLINVANKEMEQRLPTLEKNAIYTATISKVDNIKPYTIKKYPYSLEDSIKLAKEHRPDLKSLNAAVGAMNESLKYRKREYLPELSASTGYNYRSSVLYTGSYSVSANLDFPLINIMSTKYKIDEAKAQLDIAKNLFDKKLQDVHFEIQKYYTNMIQLEKKIPLNEVKVKQTAENFELANARYEVGLGNFIELQDAITNYNQAQQSYIKTVYDYNVARANLEFAIGATPEELKTAEERQSK